MEKIVIRIVGWYINISSYVSKSYAANKALSLFGTPRRGFITDKQSDFLDTAYKEEFVYDKLPIMTYRWVGKKQTILLAHGWESNSARWKNLINYLNRKDFNIVAIDAPAHGNSGGKLFNAILYSEFINVIAKRYKPDILIGHSVGGMASVLFQHKYQTPNVKKIILLGAPSEFTDVLQRYTDMLGYNERTKNQIKLTIINNFGKAPEEFSTAKFLKEISSQGLIIHDSEDKVIPYEDALSINKSFKNSKLITTKGLGHSLNDDSVANYIYEFLEN
ncbi:MAG: alpha/beta hydrolase [Flavobacteriaceae bacterium]